ncbi:MAG: hypothetical protein JWO41_320 [Candidatus Saccharibacteria bacterium]|nr:hypothetical protein [Candidatus Saccharibacteria bacterium]
MSNRRPLIDSEPLSPVGGLETLKKEFHDQHIYWKKNGELAMSAMFEALHYESLMNPELGEVLEDTIAIRRLKNDDLGASEVAGNIRGTLFGDQLELGNQPQKYYCRDDWLKPIREVVTLVKEPEPDITQGGRAERVQMNLVADSVDTSPFSRANPDEVLMQLVAERWPNGVRMLDCGAGMLTTVNQILQKNDHPMGPINVYDGTGLGHSKSEWTVSTKLTAGANYLLAQDHTIDWVLAVDLNEPYRKDHAYKWARGLLRGSELDNPEFMKTYDALAAQPHPKLSYQRLDLTDEKDVETLRAKLDGERFELITMSTVLHQLSKHDRQTMIGAAREFLAPGGLLLIKDFAWVQSTNPRTLYYYKHWHKRGRYRAFIYDPLFPNLGFQEYCRANDSRCKDLAIGAGHIAIKGELHKIEDLLFEAGKVADKHAAVIDLAGQRPTQNRAS